MPIFEFKCIDCEEFFQVLFMSGDDTKEIKCPKCSSSAVGRVVSSTNYAMGASSASKQQKAQKGDRPRFFLSPYFLFSTINRQQSCRDSGGVLTHNLHSIRDSFKSADPGDRHFGFSHYNGGSYG